MMLSLLTVFSTKVRGSTVGLIIASNCLTISQFIVSVVLSCIGSSPTIFLIEVCFMSVILETMAHMFLVYSHVSIMCSIDSTSPHLSHESLSVIPNFFILDAQ